MTAWASREEDAEINKRQIENYSTLLVSALKSTWNHFAQDVGGLFSYSGRTKAWISPKVKVSNVKDVYLKKLISWYDDFRFPHVRFL